ncbi:helix-turn-helix transcriptional regulator [Roseateles sp.]|uniref:helix-turn-helix domain-containing protein n=1 Tax=Roseateles sp. TaxID=1971397 RepID=UPI0031E275AD
MEPSQKSEKPAARTDAFDASDIAIGQRIREAREVKGFTQSAVSVRSKWVDPDKKGISRTALIGYEAGTSRPGTRELRIICETLQVSPNFLVFGAERPFEATHSALEGLKSPQSTVSEAIQVALVVMSLKDHEKGALLSLALSLAGRQLGDDRLSGLRALGMMWARDFETKIRETLRAKSDDELKQLTIEEVADLLSRQFGSNIGNKLKFEGGDIVGGEWLYPDPDPSKE